MVAVVVKKLASLLLVIVNLFRRLLCFLSRRRRNSGMILPMTAPTSLDNSHSHTQSVPSSAAEPFVMESWDHWGDEPVQNPHHNSVNNVIMGHKPVNSPQQAEPEEEPDYFSDMTPHFKKTTRILVKKNPEVDTNWRSNKLSADLTYQDPSLGTWDEGENAWDGDLDDDLVSQAENVIKETRKQERERRLAEHQRKKLDKDSQRLMTRDSRLGVRLS